MKTLNEEQIPLRYYLRSYYQPFQYECCAHYSKKLATELMNWATKIGKFKTEAQAIHTIGCDLVYWTALCFPLTKDKDKFVQLSNYFQLYCIFDDQSDEPWGEGEGDSEVTQKYWDKNIAVIETLRDESPLHKKILRNIVLRTSGHSYQRLIFNYMKKILKSGTPSFRKRYIDRFKEYMENAAIQGHMRGKENDLSVEAYKQYRLACIACITSVLMAEYLYDIQLTDQEYYHPTMQRLEKICTWQVTLTNDLFSLYKECKEGRLENVNNIIPILVSSGMTLQEAADETCSQIETAYRNFITTRDGWYNSGEPISYDARMFVTAMEHFMSGNTQWHRMSKRYHGKDFEDIVTTGIMEWGPGGTIYYKGSDAKSDQLH